MTNHLFQQDTDLAIIEIVIPYLENKTFLDIGAAKGEFTRFFAKRDLKGIFFEPLNKYKSDLLKLACETNCIFSPLAIDYYDHEADFYHAFDKSDNDVEHFSSLHPLQNDKRINHKKTNTVICRSLNSLLSDSFIENKIGIIKIDTEGNDLNVMKGMSEISTEVLMCEYFMPNVYSGWEMGHPQGLIEYANKLGFNYCIAIKRIGNIEMISLNDNNFMDKQWGNLIFISDKLYAKVSHVLQNYLKKKEIQFLSTVAEKFAEMQNICEERQEVINELQEACDERLAIINALHDKMKKFKKLRELKKYILKQVS